MHSEVFSVLYFAVASCINHACSYVTLQIVLPQCKKDLEMFIRSFSTTCAVAQLVETLRYNLEFRGLDFRWCHRILSLT